MSAFDFIETDPWPRLRQKIAEKRAETIEGLLHVVSLEGMRQQQGIIEALDWVVAEAKPSPPPREDHDDD